MADIDNSRVQRFITVNRDGTTVISMEGLTDFIMHQEGNFIFTTKSENILKTIENKSMNNRKKNVIEFLNQRKRLHFDIDDSIYLLNEDNETIQKYQIMNHIWPIYEK